MNTNVGNRTVSALDLLKQHERAIERLYTAYAARFPQEREFWLGLSQEEEGHARCLESLEQRIGEDPESLIVDRFPTAAIEHSLTYVGKLIDQAGHPSLTRVKALSAAMDVERALLENKYLEVFSSDSAALRRTLELLDRATRVHFEKIHQLWENAARPQA